MAIYCESKGEMRDGACACGAPATTDVLVGWYNPPQGVGGGQYEEMCEACHLAWDKQYEQVGDSRPTGV